MKKILLSGLIAGILLFVLAIAALYATLYLLPNLALEYYNPAFKSNETGYILYCAHPFILSFALAWFWDRFKSQFGKAVWLRDLEFGVVYSIVATLPGMWIIYSAMTVSLEQIATWVIYGFVQATVAGIVFAKVNP